MMQFICHTHIKILLEVLHLNPKIFPSNLDELKNWTWQAVLGGAGPKYIAPRGIVYVVG